MIAEIIATIALALMPAPVADIPAPPEPEPAEVEEHEAVDAYEYASSDYETAYETWYEPEPTPIAYVEQTAPENASDGLNPYTGVNYHDGRTETYYSSNVLYHYQTPEWTVDEQGFYHDSEGRYVVAASDMEQGTVFEGSMGECIVLDCGCAPGVTDYYVNW